ncbi:MAG: site-specific DNA-methyltransferase, partial [Deltaproteobacteria bacterium]|nr:site-specific DNA-methyltransferase [Deltaproteobacteria bacterium]
PRRNPPKPGDSRDQRGQLAWMSMWLSQAWRIARTNGSLLLFADWRQLPLFTDAVQAAGWIWRSTVVWDKTPQARPNLGYFRHQAEYVVFATKGPWSPPTSSALPGVLTFPVRPSAKNHVTAKPPELASALLRVLAPGSDVLDPFMGGGSLVKGAVEAGHSATGIELESESFRAAEGLICSFEPQERMLGKIADSNLDGNATI